MRYLRWWLWCSNACKHTRARADKHTHGRRRDRNMWELLFSDCRYVLCVCVQHAHCSAVQTHVYNILSRMNAMKNDHNFRCACRAVVFSRAVVCVFTCLCALVIARVHGTPLRCVNGP